LLPPQFSTNRATLLRRVARVTKIVRRADTAATEVDATFVVVVDEAVAATFAAIVAAEEASADQAAISRLRNMLRLALTKKLLPSLLRPRAMYQ
jgi:hypothetical protein